MKTVFRASLETPNFLFEGFGLTRREARKTLDDATTRHAAQYKRDPGWCKGMEIKCTRLVLGQPYRDGEPL